MLTIRVLRCVSTTVSIHLKHKIKYLFYARPPRAAGRNAVEETNDDAARTIDDARKSVQLQSPSSPVGMHTSRIGIITIISYYIHDASAAVVN